METVELVVAVPLHALPLKSRLDCLMVDVMKSIVYDMPVNFSKLHAGSILFSFYVDCYWSFVALLASDSTCHVYYRKQSLEKEPL